MLQLNWHKQTVLSESLTVSHFAVLSYKPLLNTICNALTLALHSVNKQKNNERFSELMLFQCNPNKQLLFVYCLVFPLFRPSLYRNIWNTMWITGYYIVNVHRLLGDDC